MDIIQRTFSDFEKLKENLYVQHNYKLVYQPKVSDSDLQHFLHNLMWFGVMDIGHFLPFVKGLPQDPRTGAVLQPPRTPSGPGTFPQAPKDGARPKGSPSPTDGSGLPPGGGGGVSSPPADSAGTSSTRSSGPHYPDDFGGAATATWGQGGGAVGGGAGGSLGSEGLASPSASPTETAGEGAAWENPDAPEGSGSDTPPTGGGQGGGASKGVPFYETTLEERPLQRPDDSYMYRPPWWAPDWETLPEGEKQQLLQQHEEREKRLQKDREDYNKSLEEGGETKAEHQSSGRGMEPTTSESRNPLVAGLLSWALSFSPSSSRGFDRSGEIAGESRTPHGEFWEVWMRQAPKFEDRSQGEEQGSRGWLSGGGGGGYPDEVAQMAGAESAWKENPVSEAAPGSFGVTEVTKDPTNETGPPPPNEGGEETNPDGSPIWTTSQDSGPRPSGFSLRGFSRLAPWVQPLPAEGSAPDEGWSGADSTTTVEGRRTPLVDPTLPKRSLSKEEKDEAFRLLLENPRARHASRPNTASAAASKTTSASAPQPSAYRLPDEF